jgi:hypothetical protein
MKRIATATAGVGLMLVLVGLLARTFWLIDGPRIVGDTTAPNGVRFVVVQICNWGPEPFTTRSYVRHTNGQWREYYLGHQDDLWLNGQFTSDTNHHRLTVWQGRHPRATVDWKTGRYSFDGQDNTASDGHPKPPGWDLFRDGGLHR